MVNLVIFPSGYYDVKKVDEDLKKEFEAVLSTELFDVIIFGYDKWFNESKLILSDKPDTLRKAIYRGWMMKPEQYKAFYEKLINNNIELITTPEEYERMHIFPNVYHCFGNDTAKMMVFPLYEQLDIAVLKKNFTRFMIKDYVKSVKGTDFPKFFDITVTQDEFDKWMKVFYQYRGDLLTGGICVKEYLNLKKYGDKFNEYRVFYVNHKVATISKNSAQTPYVNDIPKELVNKYANLDSVYYTVDFAELADGSWTVIEAGDGSVSGLSENQDAISYYRAIYYCLQ